MVLFTQRSLASINAVHLKGPLITITPTPINCQILIYTLVESGNCVLKDVSAELGFEPPIDFQLKEALYQDTFTISIGNA